MLIKSMAEGTAYVFADIFDEYAYTPEASVSSTQASTQEMETDQDDEQAQESTSFEIPLNTLLECLNIFGTASGSSLPSGSKFKKWKDGGGSGDEMGEGGQMRVEHYFGGGSEKRTGMRLTYNGAGHPLVVLL